MKSFIFLLSFALLSAMTFKNSGASSDPMPVSKAPIPNIEFDIQFVGTVTGTPVLNVNGTPTASSAAPKYWSAFVDEANSFGKYNFLSNKCYTLKGVGGTQNLCVTFSPNYKPIVATDYPQIQYNVSSKTFTISNAGTNCTLKVSNQICCITKIDPKGK